MQKRFINSSNRFDSSRKRVNPGWRKVLEMDSHGNVLIKMLSSFDKPNISFVELATLSGS